MCNSELDNKHRFFIQYMLTNGMVPLNNALKFMERIAPEENSLLRFKILTVEINRIIGNHGFKIVISTCEVTSEECVILLNTKNDVLSKEQHGLTPLECEYFHALMMEIVSSDDHRILYPRAINITSTLTAKYSRVQGEKALDGWIRGGYFVKENADVFLGPRTILEFSTYLRTIKDDSSCELCSELVFIGKSCQNCHKNFHSYCIEKYLQHHHICPGCKSEWHEAERQNLETMDEDSSNDE